MESVDRRLPHQGVGWSREMQRLDSILEQPRQYTRSELREAATAALAILPVGREFEPFRAAIGRLLHEHGVRGINFGLPQSGRSAR